MNKITQKSLSLLVALVMLVSMIAVVPAFAAEGAPYAEAVINEGFESFAENDSWFTVNGKGDNLPSDWDFYRDGAAVNNTLAYVAVDNTTDGMVLDLRKNKTDAADLGTDNANIEAAYVQKEVKVKETATLVTLSFRARRQSDSAKAFAVAMGVQSDENQIWEELNFDYATQQVYRGAYAANDGFHDNEADEAFVSAVSYNVDMKDFWDNIEIVYDFTAKTIEVYINGIKMTACAESTDTDSIPFSFEESVKASDIIGFRFGLNKLAQTDPANKPVDFQLDDLYAAAYDDAGAVDAALERAGRLDGAKLAADIPSLPKDVGYGVTLSWTTTSENIGKDGKILLNESNVPKRPGVISKITDEVLTATATRGEAPDAVTKYKDCTVKLLPRNVALYEDFETYMGPIGKQFGKPHSGSADWNGWARTKNMGSADRNLNFNIIDCNGNNAANFIRTAYSSEAATEQGLQKKSLSYASSGNYPSEGIYSISFKIARGNINTKTFLVKLGASAIDFGIDLITGEISAVQNATVAPEGGTIYIPYIKNNGALPVGEWLDIEILASATNSEIMIYANGVPCVYGADIAETGVKAGDTMQPITATVAAITQIRFESYASAHSTDTINYLSSFFLDDIMVKKIDKNEYACISDANAISLDTEPVINSITLPAKGANETAISWSSDSTAINTATGKATRADEEVKAILTATIKLSNATYVRSYPVTVAKKFLAAVTDSTVADNKLTAISYKNDYTLPEAPKVYVGVFSNSRAKLERACVLNPAAAKGAQSLELATPLAVAADEIIKAFVWNNGTLEPIAEVYTK